MRKIDATYELVFDASFYVKTSNPDIKWVLLFLDQKNSHFLKEINSNKPNFIYDFIEKNKSIINHIITSREFNKNQKKYGLSHNTTGYNLALLDIAKQIPKSNMVIFMASK